MDVNEHEILFKFTPRCKLKEWHFYCCSTFHSNSSVLNNDCYSSSDPTVDFQHNTEK